MRRIVIAVTALALLSGPAQAIDHSNDNSWDDICLDLAKVSRRQNGGHPLIKRSCYPAEKVCKTFLSAMNGEGIGMVLVESSDVTGKLIKREVCTINRQRDISRCTDFDTGDETAAMKNRAGDWVDISGE
jgi:hypothetical protein